jgi:hypothetical protein
MRLYTPRVEFSAINRSRAFRVKTTFAVTEHSLDRSPAAEHSRVVPSTDNGSIRARKFDSTHYDQQTTGNDANLQSYSVESATLPCGRRQTINKQIKIN